MAPVVWPGLIASCEADTTDREMWQSWWTMVQKYRIGSIARLWSVVREVLGFQGQWLCGDPWLGSRFKSKGTVGYQ